MTPSSRALGASLKLHSFLMWPDVAYIFGTFLFFLGTEYLWDDSGILLPEDVYRCQELFPYLQANKLACHSFIDVSRKHETPGSEVDFITHGTTGSMGLRVTPLPLVPHPESQRGWGNAEAGPGGCQVHSEFVSQ